MIIFIILFGCAWDVLTILGHLWNVLKFQSIARCGRITHFGIRRLIHPLDPNIK